MKTFKILLVLLAFANILHAQIRATTEDGQRVILSENGFWKYNSEDSLLKICGLENIDPGIPSGPVGKSQKILKYQAFTILYDKSIKNPVWASYCLEKKFSFGVVDRSDFAADHNMKASAVESDFYKSGYDRGHIVPAYDMSWSYQSSFESFFYTNISPQVPAFNRGIWKRLESQVRTWAKENEKIYVVTGPVLKDSKTKIGKNVVVPKYFFKAILDIKDPEVKSIAFVLPNESCGYPLFKYAITVDSVEKLIGYDLFPNLPDSLGSIIESRIDIGLWSWTPTVDTKNSVKSSKAKTTVRCKGITKDGHQCRRMTSDPSGYCWQHKPMDSDSTIAEITVDSESGYTDAVQCKAITEKGERCKRVTSDPSGYCWQHKDNHGNVEKSSVNTTTPSSSGSGRVIHTGPRGGKYYINSKGRKTYIKRK